MTSRKDPPEVADPAGHFPYKADVAHALVADNPPMGPDGDADDRVRAEDFLTAELVDATDAYVRAQEDYYRDPGEGTLDLMNQAAEDLVAARQAHRANRVGMNVVGIRAHRAGE